MKGATEEVDGGRGRGNGQIWDEKIRMFEDPVAGENEKKKC